MSETQPVGIALSREELLRVFYTDLFERHQAFAQSEEARERENPPANQESDDESLADWCYFSVSAHFDLHIKSVCTLLDTHVQHLKDKKFLDLGCGPAQVLNFISWIYDSRGYGIEFLPFVAAYAQRLSEHLQQSIGFDHLRVSVAQGNFFPSDHEVADEVKWGNIPESERSKFSSNPYEALGVTLEEIDIFYLFQFQLNTQSILELIAQRAKNGAYVLMPSYDKYEGKIVLPPELQIIDIEGKAALLQLKK